MKREIVGLISVIIIVLIVIFSFLIYNEWPLLTGKRIILATRPIDPFDPIMGQYMKINYEISTIKNTQDFKLKDSIYVILKKDEDGIWKMINVSRTKPREGDFIKGKVVNVYANTIEVKYGIEQYFFERNAEIPITNITVEISVDSFGRAKIVQLLHNGKPIEIKYRDFDIKS